MKTTIFCVEGPRQFSLQEKELHVGDTDVLVKTHQSSICGTDKNIYAGALPPGRRYPLCIGHEGGGIVVAVGPKVSRFKVGDKVMSFGLNLTFADRFVAEQKKLQMAPDGLNLDLACLGEPIACAVFSGLKSGVNLGDTVVVFGLGFAGQIIAQIAREKGAQRVICVDVVDEKLKLAEQLGADIGLNPQKENVVDAVMDLTQGKGVDVTVEAAGSETSMNQCFSVLKHNGIFVLYSWITQPIQLNISRWHDDGLEFRSTCLVHHTIEERMVWTDWALRPVIQGRIQIDPLITHKYNLNDIGAAFETVLDDPEAIKVALEP